MHHVCIDEGYAFHGKAKTKNHPDLCLSLGLGLYTQEYIQYLLNNFKDRCTAEHQYMCGGNKKVAAH